MPTPRFILAGAVGPGGKIYGIGGANYIGGTSFVIVNAVESFTP